jgi:hypothetical protein
MKLQESLEQKEIQLSQKEFKQAERQRQRIKRKADKAEAKKLKKQLREEFRNSRLQARQEWEKLSEEDKRRAKRENIEEKKRARHERKAQHRERIRSIIQLIRSVNWQTVKAEFRTFRDNAPKRRRFLIIFFNSTVLFLLSYFVLFFLSQLVTVIAAGFFDYPTIVYYYEIYFNISQEAWYHDSVKTIFASGPLVNFIIGITFFIIYHRLKEIQGVFKLFFLWGFLHAVNMLFGAMLVGTLFEAGVGHVISWMYVMDTGKVLYSIFSVFLLVVAGMIAVKPFLISANTYYNEINLRNRTSFIIAQVLLPYLAGNLFLLVLRQPRFVLYDTLTTIVLIISIIPIMATYMTYNDLYFEEEEKKPRLAWLSFLILAMLVVFFRVVLASGLRIGA